MAKARSLEVELTVKESSGEMYSSDKAVATQKLIIPLPANGRQIGDMIVRHLALLNGTVNQFRGPVEKAETEVMPDLNADLDPILE